MGTDNIHKIERSDRMAREYKVRDMRENTWLILCEGKKTEPNYFNGLIRFLNKDRKTKIKAKIEGLGRNTDSLVESVDKYFLYVDKYYRGLNIPYANIIFAFDKDSFKDGNFNRAIELGKAYKKKKGVEKTIVAWSNESFELWICLHFEYISSRLTRDQYNNKLTTLFRKKGIFTKHQNYEDNGKNLETIFEDILLNGGSLETALSNAKRLSEICGQETSCALMNPATNMYEAVIELSK